MELGGEVYYIGRETARSKEGLGMKTEPKIQMPKFLRDVAWLNT